MLLQQSLLLAVREQLFSADVGSSWEPPSSSERSSNQKSIPPLVMTTVSLDSERHAQILTLERWVRGMAIVMISDYW
jgi:hypothetical protein